VQWFLNSIPLKRTAKLAIRRWILGICSEKEVSCRSRQAHSGYATGVKKEQRTGNWTPDGEAERAAAQRDFRELTPAQRTEQAFELARFLSRLAETGRRRRLG
jgi:hypothetical protein